jgi:PAS domain S-box-containing protein
MKSSIGKTGRRKKSISVKARSEGIQTFSFPEMFMKTRRVKNSLFESATLRWMFEFATQGILITDAQLKIRSCNKWLEKQSGKKEEDLITKQLFEVFPDLKRRGFDRYYQDALNGESRLLSHLLHKYLLPLPLNTPAGELIQMQQSARISPLLDGEKVIGTITIIEDVTERVIREMELNLQIREREQLLKSELAARQLAEESNRLKDQFLATVSHEVRTPLNSISGWIQILLKGNLDEKQYRHALDTIQKSVNSQTQIIEDLLDISRIVTGQIGLNLRPVNLAESLEAALDVVRPAAHFKEIGIIENFEAKSPLIMGDSHRLQQIFWNLLSNAIKFTPFKGQVEIILNEKDELAEITFRDNGSGISADFLPFVFDRFRQADGSMKRRHGGLGLGLSIVKNLVEMHGGTVTVESSGENEGTTFTVSLPLLQSSKNYPSSEELQTFFDKTASMDFGGVRILIVDDETDSREMLKYFLESSKALIKARSNALEALHEFSIFKPDILISDLGMPGMDGYDLIKKIRALPAEAGGQIPAVALTGYVSLEEKKRVREAGFNTHVAKPVDLPELVKILSNLLHK